MPKLKDRVSQWENGCIAEEELIAAFSDAVTQLVIEGDTNSLGQLALDMDRMLGDWPDIKD